MRRIRFGAARYDAEILFTRQKLEKYLRQLGISEEDVITALREPEDLAYGTLTDRYIALNYAKKLAVVYEKENDETIGGNYMQF